MPHLGHADSVTNDEHGSRSDVSDWSSPKPRHSSHQGEHYQPPLFSLFKSFSNIHTGIHPIRPCLPDDSGPEPPEG